MIEIQDYAGNPADGDGQHVAVSVGGVRIAGAVRLRQRHSATDPNAMRSYLTPCIVGADVRPTEIRDEAHARQWLRFLAELYCATARVSDDPPAETIAETDLADDLDQLSAAELDDLLDAEEEAYREDVASCCGGTDPSCGHFRSYSPAAFADRW